MKNKDKKLKCLKCGQEVNYNEKVCNNCGEKLKSRSYIKFLFKTLLIMPLFTILPIIIMLVILMDNNSSPNPNLAIIEKTIGVSSTDAININNILKSVGIEKVSNITHDEILDDDEGNNTNGYRIKTDFSNNVILYLDSSNKVISIRWLSKDFYRDEKVLLSFKDYIVNASEEAAYMTNSESVIQQVLKSPSSAKFPNITEWKIVKDNGIVTVQSYVDSQNSFGAMLRSDFQIKYSKEGEITSLIFDGKEYIK